MNLSKIILLFALIGLSMSFKVWVKNPTGKAGPFTKWAGWTLINGGLSNITVCGNGDTWGTNTANLIYRKKNGVANWTNVGGRLAKVSCSEDNTIWGITKNITSDGGYVYFWNGKGWSRSTGLITSLSVQNKNMVWAVNGKNQIYNRKGSKSADWVPYSKGGRLSYIHADAKGNVWGVAASGNVYYKNKSGNWSSIDGNLRMITSGKDGRLFGITKKDGIWTRAGAKGKWAKLNGSLTWCGTNMSGHMYGVNKNSNIWFLNTVSGAKKAKIVVKKVKVSIKDKKSMKKTVSKTTKKAMKKATPKKSLAMKKKSPAKNNKKVSAKSAKKMNTVSKNAALTKKGQNKKAESMFKFKGCYKDTGSRDLPKYIGALANNMASVCGARCNSKGYKYFGMQVGTQCFCGNKFGRYGKSNNCKSTCKGNKGEKNKCGGGWANSVYEIKGVSKQNAINMANKVVARKVLVKAQQTLQTYKNKLVRAKRVVTSQAPLPTTPFTFKGCFRDRSNRDFTKFIGRLGNCQPSVCGPRCNRLGYKYFGMQVGTECFCGNSFGKYGHANNCDMKCKGNNSKCGGGWANSVYQSNKPINKSIAKNVVTKITRLVVRARQVVTKAKAVVNKPTVLVINAIKKALKKVVKKKKVAPTPVAKFSYLGCYKDNRNRDLNKYAGSFSKNRAAFCGAKCNKLGYQYFGMQVSTQCFCGAKYGSYGKAKNCTSKCAGNKGE